MPVTQKLDRNMPILVVDDYPSMRRIVKNCLRQLGFENVAEAENGEAALQHLADHDCSLIISDWSVPDMKGEELLEALRENSRLQEVPLIVVAQENQRQALSKIDENPHSRVIVKPVTRDILEQKMTSLFN